MTMIMMMKMMTVIAIPAPATPFLALALVLKARMRSRASCLSSGVAFGAPPSPSNPLVARRSMGNIQLSTRR